MATVTISTTGTTYRQPEEIDEFLGRYGIWYRRFEEVDRLQNASHEEILEAFDEPIQQLKTEGGYRTADIIDVDAATPGLDAMLAKFASEHWHDEDEVRFIVKGRGVFHIHPTDDPVFRIQVEAGDMIKVPHGTHHWFDLCDEKRVLAVRLFQDPSGWTPHYTGMGEETHHEPVCFGPIFVSPVPPAS